MPSALGCVQATVHACDAHACAYAYLRFTAWSERTHSFVILRQPNRHRSHRPGTRVGTATADALVSCLQSRRLSACEPNARSQRAFHAARSRCFTVLPVPSPAHAPLGSLNRYTQTHRNARAHTHAHDGAAARPGWSGCECEAAAAQRSGADGVAFSRGDATVRDDRDGGGPVPIGRAATCRRNATRCVCGAKKQRVCGVPGGARRALPAFDYSKPSA